MGKTIVIDPGHGLNKKGIYSRPLMDCTGDKAKIVKRSMYPHKNDYTKGFYREDFGTLDLANKIADYLADKEHTVYVTRDDEKNAADYLSRHSDNEWKKEHWSQWKWIVDFTNNINADIFISLHTNAGGGAGCSVFWESEENGIKLSKAIANELKEQIGIKTRRIAKHRYMVLRNECEGRSVLLEVLFHDNINEIKLLLEKEDSDRIAQAIADGIDKYSQTF